MTQQPADAMPEPTCDMCGAPRCVCDLPEEIAQNAIASLPDPIGCPFCGDIPAEDYGETGHTIECVNRQCIAPSIFLDHEGEDFDTRSACVHRWNTRNSPPALSAETVEKLNQVAHLLNIAACSLEPWQAVVEALEVVNGILPAKPTDDGEK